MGKVNDIDPTALYDDDKSLSEGALTVPGYSMDGWFGRIFAGAGFDLDLPIARYSSKQLADLLHPHHVGEPQDHREEDCAAQAELKECLDESA